MADKEIYVGTVGPFLIDDADELYNDGNQVATKGHVSTSATSIAAHISNISNPHDTTLDQVVIEGNQATVLFGCNSKIGFTPTGGLVIKLTNKSGGSSVKGTIITTSDSYENAFKTESAEYEAVGICYESGIADGAECWVVVSGIAEVLLKDGTAATKGYWVKCADTDGRAEVTTAPVGIGALSVAEHFKEIGHCLEDKVAGTDVLVKVVLHFN